MAFGIPTLLNEVNNVVNTVNLLAADVLGLLTSRSFLWGVYDNSAGSLLLQPDNIISVEYKNEFKISDYPIELGTFSNYNKVNLPYLITVRMSKGGSQDDRDQFLQSLAALAPSTTLVSIITPEKYYFNANIIGYDYRRTATNGAGLIIVDLRFEEVRLTGSLTFSNTQSQSDSPPVNDGQLSPSSTVINPPAAVSSAAQNQNN